MILELVQRFHNNRKEIERSFREEEPSSYGDIVERVMVMTGVAEPGAVTARDGDSYFGTEFHAFRKRDTCGYIVVAVSYGTCPACDAFESAKAIIDDDKRIGDYMTLALHIVQNAAEVMEV